MKDVRHGLTFICLYVKPKIIQKPKFCDSLKPALECQPVPLGGILFEANTN